MLLLSLAAFIFVLRTTEYIIVSEHISNITDNQNVVGFVQHPHGGHNDISHVADILWESGFLYSEDRRKGFEAVLRDGANVGISGM